MNEIRWTDKVYLDSQGNIRSTDGCPTDQLVCCAKPIDNEENKEWN